MPDLYKGIECKPYLISLNQIEVFQKDSGTSPCMLEKISSSWKDEFNCNFALPLVCLTDREDTYHLLTKPVDPDALLSLIQEAVVGQGQRQA